MDEELLSKLHRIIDELPDEGSRIDYKDIPYLDTQKAEFIRDLCAFLNCDESYGEEKYIIFGIRNNKEIVGLNSVQMQDDNYYQQLADFIFPRPSIKTGTFIHNVNEIDYCFGYINILGTNNDRIYEINRDKNFSKNNTEINEKLIVRAHTAWIRMGSTKKQLTEYQRRKIYEKDFNTKTVNSFPHVNFTNFDSLVINDKVLKAVFLFGEWDENNENDKFIISEYIGQPYEEWIPVVRIFAKENNEIIEYKNGIWKVKDKFNSLKNYASNYYKEDLLKFGEIVNRILSDRNTKFDLNADQRSMASIYKKGTLYSKTLRKSVAEALVLISANTISFVNCKNEANNLSFIVVRKILSTSDWEIWASLDHLLPLLAEAAPEEYLSQLHNKLISEPEVIQSLFTEHENDIISNNYSTGLIWSLELMAWENRNLIISCMLLLKLAMFDSKVIENIAKIILPWYPQTKAPIENRILVVKTILKENPSMGWKLLMLLMPGKIKSASPTYQPIWINRVDDKTTVNNSEYWKEIDAYVDIAISNAKTNTRKLCDLENVIDDVPKTIFNKIFDKLSSSEITKLNDTRKYIIWDHLMDMITWHKRSKNSKLPHEALQQLEILADKITPNNKLVLAKRYFKKNTWDLIENRKDGKNQLEEKQMQLSNEIYTIGIDTMIDFINNIEDSRHFGACLAQNDMNKIKEAEILNFLGSNNQHLVECGRGYVYRKFHITGFSWVEQLNVSEWKLTKQLNFLTELPCSSEIFEFVEKVLGDQYLKYWKNIDIRFVENDEELNYAISKLYKVKRPEKVIDLVGSRLYEVNTLNINLEIVIQSLNELIQYQDRIGQIEISYIQKVITYLQCAQVPKDKLLSLEWKYLVLLDGEESRPITIEKSMAENPEEYNFLLSLVYKPHSKNEKPKKIDESVAANAYRLLFHWQVVPGMIEGKIDKDILNRWYNDMKEICTKSDHLEVGLHNFGRVLFYSPKDSDGFWIDKNVAELLNGQDAEMIRKGYSQEAYNSLGMVNYDSTGKAYDDLAIQYEEKAEQAEKEGFFRLANEMRKMATSYKYEAEQMREYYYDE